MSLDYFNQVNIFYASETGNAKQLARQLLQQLKQAKLACYLAELNSWSFEQLQPHDLQVIICSTTSSGEAPANGHRFADFAVPAKSAFNFAVFGLGDINYAEFCQFAVRVDAKLSQAGGNRAINLVKADLNYQQLFTTWQQTLFQVLKGNLALGKQLNLSVVPYSQANCLQAPVVERVFLGTTHDQVVKLKLNIQGSGIYYQPGDWVYIIPPSNPALIEEIVNWYGFIGEPARLARQQLAKLELKKLSIANLRQLARLLANSVFTALLKLTNRGALNKYLYMSDMLDILQEFDPQRRVSFTELCQCLSKILPRAYSACSISNQQLEILLKVVNYSHKQRRRLGTFSSSAVSSQMKSCALYIQANPSFHLPADSSVPIIMLATGTGIAPFIAFLRQLEFNKQHQEVNPCYLFFGEKYQKTHFYYQDELENYLVNNTLTKFFKIFSRDVEPKQYITDVFLQQGEIIWSLMEQGAHIYVCGNITIFKVAIDALLLQIGQVNGGLTALEAKDYLNNLKQQQRLHLDVF